VEAGGRASSGCSVVAEIFACDGAREVAADHGHVDRVLLHIGAHHDFLVEGAGADDRVGMGRAVAVDITVVAIVRAPGAACTAIAAGAGLGRPAAAAAAPAGREGPAAEAIAAVSVGPGTAQRLPAIAAFGVGTAAVTGAADCPAAKAVAASTVTASSASATR